MWMISVFSVGCYKGFEIVNVLHISGLEKLLLKCNVSVVFVRVGSFLKEIALFFDV